MTVVPLHKPLTQREIVEATGRAIGRQRREVDDEIATLRAEVEALRNIVNALPSAMQMTTALTASRVLGKRYLGEVRRGLDQLRGVANNFDINGEDIDQDEHIAAAEAQVKAAIAEWHLAKSLPPKVALRMRDSSKPNLAGGRKLSDHLRISLLRTIEHDLGGDPADIVVRGQNVRIPKTGMALIQRSADLRAALRGLRGDMAGEAKTLRLASLSADAGLLLGADVDEVESVQIAVEEVVDILTESAQRCEDGALRLAKLYADVRRAHLEKADGLVPELSGDIAVEFERLSAEYQNALADTSADQSIYRMRTPQRLRLIAGD